jgi:hypothetical protein
MFVKLAEPKNLIEVITLAIPALSMTLILGWFLHRYLEKPYLINKIPRLPSLAKKKVLKLNLLSPSPFRRNIAVTLLVILLLSWYGFRIPTRLTALVVDQPNTQIPPEILLTSKPLELPFTAAHNSLGMLFFHFKPLKEEEIVLKKIQPGSDTHQSLVVAVFDETGKEVGENNYALYQIWESRFHPVGIPILKDSADKKYTVKLFVSSQNAMQQITLINSGKVFRSVYFFSKSELLKRPQVLISLLAQKIFQPFTEKETQNILLYTSPFLLAVFLFAPKSLDSVVTRFVLC